MRIVIVTGASGGLGAEFVRRIDRLGILEDWGIDEIWGIARSGDKLRKLGETLHTLSGRWPSTSPTGRLLTLSGRCCGG